MTLTAKTEIVVRERGVPMRKVLGLFVAMLMCVVLSSCASSPEKAFMGTWKGTYDGEPVELSFFMVKNIVIWKIPRETIAGTWTIDHEGKARMTVDDEKFIATLVTDDKIVVQYEGDSEAALLEKIDSKKK